MKHLSTVAGLCAAGSLAAALLASGAVAAEQRAGRDVCRADVERVCKNVQPGGGRIAQCLKDNEASVSPACKEHMAKVSEHMHQRMQAFEQACEGDVEQHCKDVQPGQGRMVRCLRNNESKLSASCKEELAQMDEQRRRMQERMHGVAEACKGDAQQYCKDVRPGGGRVARCLKDNEAKLSAGCKAALQPS